MAVAAAQSLPHIVQRDEQATVEGIVVAYDWSTRYYMEGARLEDFVFRVDGANQGNAELPTRYVRIRLLWHRADQQKIMPDSFYAPGKRWRVSLSAWSPFDFVRELCGKPIPQTIAVETGKGKVELPRYVDPAILPPDKAVEKNFATALTLHPRPADVPNPETLPCLFLTKVVAAPIVEKSPSH
jgi:hypothetical protein